MHHRRVRNLRLEPLEPRILLAGTWQNTFNPYDVNEDGFVGPGDPLSVITSINEGGGGPLPDPVPQDATPPYVDVNGDGHMSPVDPLTVIDLLNLGEEIPLLAIGEGNRFVTQVDKLVELGQAAGTRTLRFDLATEWDVEDERATVEDRLLVYLVDPADPARTLLDRGQAGTALFSLSGDVAEFTPGQVQFDGRHVQIDVTPLRDLSQGALRFQLVNTDGDTRSKMLVTSVSSDVDPAGTPPSYTHPPTELVAAGNALDLTGFEITAQIQVEVSSVRWDTSNHRYLAEMRLHNLAEYATRQVVVAFPELPEGVELVGASGSLPSDVPYLNMRPTIHGGGLDQGATSESVLLAFDNPASRHFVLVADVYVGGPNRSPELEPVIPLSVMPGGYLAVPISASDPDDDPLTLSIRGGDRLPTFTIGDDATLILTPTPAEVGSYQLTLVASDGTAEDTQPLTIDVPDDPLDSTRISGAVLNTEGQPLAGVPVRVGSFETATAADGTFLLELPADQLPTAALDIPVPAGDPYFDPLNTGTQTIPLTRSIWDPATGHAPHNPRQHPNMISTFIDAGMVYGSDAQRAAALRTNDGSGKLKLGPGDLLPQNNATFFPEGPLDNAHAGLVDPGELFVAGDVRAPENVGLTALHTLLAREHNRKADETAAARPGLTGEEIYQEARRWVYALVQHITYQEFLPVLLGEGAIPAYGGYDPTLDPSISGLFSTAAYRLGHSLIAPVLPRLDDNNQPLAGGALPVRDAFFNPAPLLDDGIEPYLRGLTGQPAEELDVMVVDDLRNFLFGPPGAGGLDLPSLNIQRGRDMGLPSYNQARVDCELPRAESFADITPDPDVQLALASVYETVDDVDVWIGGLAEEHVPGAMVGELFQVIVRDQFLRLRDGDRFWYENAQLTADELAEMRATTLADVILRNTSIAALPDSVFTIGGPPAGPAEGGGGAGAISPTEFRSFDGSENNPYNASVGRVGTNLRVDHTVGYGDGISSPAGADRPSARAISNAVVAQSDSFPNAAGATSMMTLWGQLVDHDIDLTPAGIANTLHVDGTSFVGAETYPDFTAPLPVLLGHDVYGGFENVVARPVYLPAADEARAVAIDPHRDSLVSAPAIPDGSLRVAADSLLDGQGNPIATSLSMTDVPVERDLIALPEGVEIVGAGLVGPDGSVIETSAGGILVTGWHFLA